MNRLGFPSVSRTLVLAGAVSGAVLASGDARAQQAGTSSAPLPNVLLLVDTSGSMERNTDDSLPKCTPGTLTAPTPNRWGMLLQALTGNVQPFYSCYDQSRGKTSSFALEYQIAGTPPLDTDYVLDHYRPVSGTGAPSNICVVAPYKVPGVGAGVGPGNLSEGTGYAEDFPPDALASVTFQHLTSTYGNNLTPGIAGTLSPGGGNACTFLQASDGQLDVAQDFVRFALMTFDTDPAPGVGVHPVTREAAVPWHAEVNNAGPPNDPFTGAFSWWRSPGNVATASLTSPPSGYAVIRTNKNPAGTIGPGPVGGRPTIGGCTAGAGNGGQGNCCVYTPMEVGSRHFAAPPWEGRAVLFPDPNGSLTDIEATNQQIQDVIRSSRPFGATPLDGMFDDARDFLWYSSFGPFASSGPYHDPYVINGCRKQYIVLLTDGAPNLDMRAIDPTTGVGCKGPDCPYDYAYLYARSLYKDKGSNLSIKTFVIGFSVNGTALNYPDANNGFPKTLAAANQTCKGFMTDPGFGGSGGPGPSQMATTMNQLCYQQAACPGPYTASGWKVDPGTGKCVPPKGSTMEACCQLTTIAFEGSGGAAPWGTDTPIPPFFADSQSDIETAFASILATITKTATTRTVPAQAASVNVAGLATPIAATFNASFVPDARKPWSGEIVRNRSYCSGLAPTPIAPTTGQGDSYAVDLATQAGAGRRWFITAKGDPAGPSIDSARTMRPFSANADGIQTAAYKGQEIGNADDTLYTNYAANFPDMLRIDDNTCKRSVVVRAGQAQQMAALNKSQCSQVVWDFTVAHAGGITFGGPFDYNFRCSAGGNPTNGTCSLSNNLCTVGPGPGGCNTVPGDTCVPGCTALGAIFRSSPVVVGPPSAFLRDDGYQGFSSARRTRRPTVFVATTDGVMHGLMGVETGAVGAANQGGAPPNNTPYYEFWAFVPPAVLPKLASNYPGGQQILLDGTAAVKDVVWYRDGTNPQPQNDWHTTLVAGFGAAGGGYYALNVSDSDCAANGNTACAGGLGWTAATEGTAITAATGADTSGGRQPGPHFLWQITDIEQSGAETAKVTRSYQPTGAPTPTPFVALFGKQTYTPTIATLQMTAAGKPVQVGVAILPGGLDGSPAKVNGACTVGTDCCQRAVAGGYGGFGAAQVVSAPIGQVYGPRTTVRKWGKTCTPTDPVPGRGVTIVRLDTGEIIRHFGRKSSADVPALVKPVTIDSPFDSPIIGTPTVYPNAVGVPAQKIYVGDADGTMWRIDVSTPCDIGTPSTCNGVWNVTLFQDMIGNGMPTGGASAGKSQPIALPMVASQTPLGTIVVNAATGEQENIISSTDENFVVSVEDQRPAPGLTQQSILRWFEKFGSGERVTGPMTVFDRTLYFATYRPQSTANVCAGTAQQFLWGVDYLQPAGGLLQPASNGGDCRWTQVATGGPVIGRPTCAPGLVPGQDMTVASGGNLIPGVTVQASLACSQFGASDQFSSGLQSLTPTTYSIVAGVSNGAVGGLGTPSASALQIPRNAPRTAATLDAWAFITD
jgi:type IV pilus assembly protein PilY1